MKFAVAFILLASGGCFSPLCAQLASNSGGAPGAESSLQQSAPPQRYGRIQGDTYISPTGLYRVKIPVLPLLGGTISDTPNVVTFDDDFSIHLSLGAFPLTQELKSDLETRGAKDFLTHFFDNIVMPDFVSNFPGSTREQKAILLPHIMDGAVLLFSLHPGGSNFELRSTISRRIKPVVAKRGNLCFVKYGYVFVVSTEVAERALERSTYNKTADEEDAILRQRLLDLVAKMEFSPPPPEGKN
jgi:hypothetical protein